MARTASLGWSALVCSIVSAKSKPAALRSTMPSVNSTNRSSACSRTLLMP
jgi:hypothetical protein